VNAGVAFQKNTSAFTMLVANETSNFSQNVTLERAMMQVEL
jgi:hypothetical protein